MLEEIRTDREDNRVKWCIKDANRQKGYADQGQNRREYFSEMREKQLINKS